MIVSRSGSASAGGGGRSGVRRGSQDPGHSSPDAPGPSTLMGEFLLSRPIAVVARVVAPGRGSIERVEALTPYAVQRITEDARAAGTAAELDITVRGPAAPGTVAGVREVFAELVARGVRVQVSVAPSTPVATRRRPAA
jgi:hypothetical protein